MEFLKKVKKAWHKWHPPDEVKSFNQDQAEEGAFEHIQRGRQSVPLERIVGSVGRYQDFDSRFRPKQHLTSDRYESIKQAFREGRCMPPVKLYQIKDEYYVLDGNHRIAAAKELGRSDIEATIVEFLPSKNILENLLYRQRARFSEKTGLPYNINLTEVGQYDYLLDQIAQHQQYLDSRSESVTYESAAMDWYQQIYRPLVAIIRNGDLLKYFPRRTMDDLYAYVSYHQWEEGKKRKYGIGIDRLIPNNMEAFREKMANQCKDEYPEMLREITAFVLLNIRAKNESRILDKLFDLKEVQEVHSIHGNVDVLTKIVLKRDLLSSDAEIISVFVNEQMRQIPGVISTQTLIPGASRIK
ncbi:MAG: Lrp/AsnC ligand binding domain-containing protein [Desulfosarcinaceae bacterium]